MCTKFCTFRVSVSINKQKENAITLDRVIIRFQIMFPVSRPSFMNFIIYFNFWANFRDNEQSEPLKSNKHHGASMQAAILARPSAGDGTDNNENNEYIYIYIY